MPAQLDIAANRAAGNYSLRETLLRVLWMVGSLIFRLTPRPCFGLRARILILFGARIGEHVRFYPSSRIYFPWNLDVGDWSAIGEEAFIYNLGQITIGEKVTISHRAHLCAGTHDYQRANMQLQKVPIQVQDQAWICTEAYLGPGVIVGTGAIVGARAVVTKSVAPWSIMAGNPARPIGDRQLLPLD